MFCGTRVYNIGGMVEPDVSGEAFLSCLDLLDTPGAVLLLPTETVYGLMCSWHDFDSRSRIFRMKSRDEGKPLQMLADSLDRVVEAGVDISPEIAKVAGAFCPGPVTIVAKMNPTDNAGLGTVGFRIPDCPLVLELIRRSGKILAATSANLAGEPPAATVEMALETLSSHPDIALDAGTLGSIASTVIDMTSSEARIMRPGPVTEDDLAKIGIVTLK